MPLKIAEQPKGWLVAINKCDECPFLRWLPPKRMFCDKSKIEERFELKSGRIPMWCPLTGGIL